MLGRFCRVEPLDPDRHAADLFVANSEDTEGRNWTYLPEDQGPHRSLDLYRRWTENAAKTDDPLWHAIVETKSGRAVGVAAYARIDRASGVIEVGGINYSPRLQRQSAATEAMYLMMRRVFDELGYRRYEWKCDSLNAPSRAAALRSLDGRRSASARDAGKADPDGCLQVPFRPGHAFEADDIVVTAGIGTADLVATVGLTLPITASPGYPGL